MYSEKKIKPPKLFEGAAESEEVSANIAELVEDYAGYIMGSPENKKKLTDNLVEKVKNLDRDKLRFSEITFKNVSIRLARYSGGTNIKGALINELISEIKKGCCAEELPEGGYVDLRIRKDKEGNPELRINKSHR